MRSHGRIGNLAIYRMVLAVESCVGWSCRVVSALAAGAVRHLRKPDAPAPGKPRPGGGSG
ncbi:hypothetical protein [Hoeflea olei]|nr:hypothetical protein [Hoeflea olei]